MKGRDKGGKFEKGYTPWNYEGNGRLKRKFKRFNGKLILNSHFVWLKHNKLTKVPKGYVIHHKDGDSLNDKIENLILMEDIEHRKLHNRKAGHALIHNPHRQKITSHVGAPLSEDTPENEMNANLEGGLPRSGNTKASGTSDKGCGKEFRKGGFRDSGFICGEVGGKTGIILCDDCKKRIKSSDKLKGDGK